MHDRPRATLRAALRRLGAGAGVAGLLGVALSALAPPAARADAGVAADSALAPPFAVAPLDTPLVVTGSFGEHRPRHFHAGIDFSTGGVVGRPVRAPADGWVERLHTQGLGYGRSIYLHSTDGRLLVFGHLDAFDGPIAEFVSAAQESSGQYEVDLWPGRGRLAVRAGERIAWSGESGTNDPHLHLEVRWGELALNPLRAGFPQHHENAPVLRAVTLEPLDPRSWVERGAAPLTRPLLAARAETLRVEGRVRVLVRAEQPGARGSRLAPWRVRASFGDGWIEWRADSASWVRDMGDVDYVYDSGRAVPSGSYAFLLWAPARGRSSLLRASTPDSTDAGTIEVAAGDPPRPLRLEAESADGTLTTRDLWLRGPGPDERGPAATGGLHAAPAVRRHRRRGRRVPQAPARGFELDPLPDRFVRVRYSGAPRDLREVRIGEAIATWRDGAWSAIVSPGDRWTPVIRGARTGGAAWGDSLPPFEVAREAGGTPRSAEVPLEWRLERSALFERDAVLIGTAAARARGTAELAPLGPECVMGPASLPLREPARLRLPVSGPLVARAGLYGEFGAGWEWLGGATEGAESLSVSGETRQLGRFAAFADTLAPRVRMFRAHRHAEPGPYSTWELKARVMEFGSGVDARGSAFIVDGTRVPTEWDTPRDLLRWRPARRPARGVHHYLLEVRDRAGNVRRTRGSFVLD
jgi:hypothetical protein